MVKPSCRPIILVSARPHQPATASPVQPIRIRHAYGYVHASTVRQPAATVYPPGGGEFHSTSPPRPFTEQPWLCRRTAHGSHVRVSTPIEAFHPPPAVTHSHCRHLNGNAVNRRRPSLRYTRVDSAAAVRVHTVASIRSPTARRPVPHRHICCSAVRYAPYASIHGIHEDHTSARFKKPEFNRHTVD